LFGLADIIGQFHLPTKTNHSIYSTYQGPLSQKSTILFEINHSNPYKEQAKNLIEPKFNALANSFFNHY